MAILNQAANGSLVELDSADVLTTQRLESLQMQAFLLRKKLELLEHAVEHAMEAKGKNTELSKIQLEEELQEIKAMRAEISANGHRLTDAFTSVGENR